MSIHFGRLAGLFSFQRLGVHCLKQDLQDLSDLQDDRPS